MEITVEIMEARERGIEDAAAIAYARMSEGAAREDLLEEFEDEYESNMANAADPDLDEDERCYFLGTAYMFRKAHVMLGGIESKYHPYFGGYRGLDNVVAQVNERRGW